MSNSHEQSLNENVVFLPISESTPEFLHCERERYALETLLSLGPGAFYTRLSQESLAPFLSPEEVNQISGWAQNYHVSQLQLENEEEKEEEVEEGLWLQGFSDCYFPTHSDTPAPCLVLGWPERMSLERMDRATVYTNPPAEGQPNIRAVIRRLLQGATKVIAIVTDRLTDNAVIGDLHAQASRGVPVYLILNQRSIQENFTPHRLTHPNIQVRVLGGKTYCTREGKMVVGEMKDNFLLVDLETVVQGSYSLTWSDVHLHRQLVTVLSGQVVESFDQEFRILFAASLPIPDSWKVAKNPMGATLHSEKSDQGLSNRLPMEPFSSPEPCLPSNSPLDWEAMGVLQRHQESPVNLHRLSMTAEEPLLFSPHEKRTLLAKESNRYETRFLEEERACVNSNFAKRNQQDDLISLKNRRRSETDFQTFPEKEHRVQTETRRSFFRERSWQRSHESEEEGPVQPHHDNADEISRQDTTVLSTHLRCHQPTRRQDTLEEESKTAQGQSEFSSRPDSPSSSRVSARFYERVQTVKGSQRAQRPLILRMPHSESFSSLSDIMRRLQPRQSSSGLMARASKSTVSELSRSMMDLSTYNAETSLASNATAPKLQANYFDPFRVTPALALMKKRNDDLRTGMLRQPTTSKTFLPVSRPRNSSFGVQMDWRRPQADRNRGREETP